MDDDLRQVRLAKLTRLREIGRDPYPPRVRRTHTTAEAIALFERAGDGDTSTSPEVDVSVAGRVMSVRHMGKVLFAHVQDAAGRLQLYVRRDDVGDEAFEGFLSLVDVGDIVGAQGGMFRTRMGEISVHVRAWQMLAKALRPLPEKWHGLPDVETRYRQRYVDLIANPEVRTSSARRATSCGPREAPRPARLPRGRDADDATALRRRHGAPVHHAPQRARPAICSCASRPSCTSSGSSSAASTASTKSARTSATRASRHAPQPRVHDARVVPGVRRLHRHHGSHGRDVASVARRVLGRETITYAGHEIDLRPPWRRLTLRDAIRTHADLDIEAFPDHASLHARLREMRIQPPEHAARGKLVDEVLKTIVQPRLIEPTFLTEYPLDLSPLAKRTPHSPDLTERFQPFIGGLEIGNAFTELNDPLDQRERFTDQMRQRAAGDEEAQVLDEDFLLAMEHGMPPTGGLGIGVDRLVMLLCDKQSIREVVLFPQLREG